MKAFIFLLLLLPTSASALTRADAARRKNGSDQLANQMVHHLNEMETQQLQFEQQKELEAQRFKNQVELLRLQREQQEIQDSIHKDDQLLKISKSGLWILGGEVYKPVRPCPGYKSGNTISVLGKGEDSKGQTLVVTNSSSGPCDLRLK